MVNELRVLPACSPNPAPGRNLAPSAGTHRCVENEALCMQKYTPVDKTVSQEAERWERYPV